MANIDSSPKLQLLIEELCRFNGITCEFQQGCRERAWRKVKTIRIRPIRNMANFVTALHEIGHIVGPHSGNRLEKEYAAWLWALENSPIIWDSSAWLELHASLRSYVTWAENRQYRRKSRPVIPAKTHPMWLLLARAKENF